MVSDEPDRTSSEVGAEAGKAPGPYDLVAAPGLAANVEMLRSELVKRRWPGATEPVVDGQAMDEVRDTRSLQR